MSELIGPPLAAVLYALAVTVMLINIKLLVGHFDRKPMKAEFKLDTAHVADNHYTVQAARANAEAAESNARAEEARLERARREAPPG